MALVSVAEVGGELVTGPTKTHQSRSVALPAFLRDLLAEHIAERADDPEAFVFLAPDGGQLRHQNFGGDLIGGAHNGAHR